MTKILNACVILHVIWQASRQFECMLVLILYLQYITITLYSSLLGTSKSVGNLQYRLQDVHVPALGILQHEGKSAHILRFSGADTFSIASGQVRRMLSKLLFPAFCSDS